MKRFILAFYFILYVLLGSAQNVTIENANKIADEYIKSSAIFCNSQTENSIRKLASIDRATTKSFSILGEVPMYLVQLEDGWVLVASDSISKPILASSPTGVFPDLEDMPDGMKWLLSQYEIAIKFALDSIQNRTVNPQWNNLSSFINSKTIDTISVNYQTFTLPNSYRLNRIDSVFWNQYGNNDSNGALCEKSYNKFCPDWYTPYCGRTYVGCSSVALGIVLWYHQWPTHAYIYNTIDSTAVVSEETHLVLYNWNDILPKLFNTTPDYNVDAVAGLLRDCGYAGKTEYGEKGSSSNLSKTKNALENTFNFKKNIEHKYKKYYSSQDWENKIKSEIVSGRPVLYRGAEPDGGGHAFVLYGYTGDAFNIHWGWGGNSNAGLYTLDPLDPSPSSNGPYSEGQAALFGVEPDYHCEALELIGSHEDDTCCLVQGGSITLSDYVISENQVGYYYSGTCIRLTNGFHAKAGSEVHIAVTDVPCNLTEDATASKLAAKSFNQSDNIWCNQWNILSHGQESNPNDPFPHARTSIYWLSENTVNRNGYEYIPLMCSSSKPNVESTQLVGELRFTEEDKQVYFYYDNTEYLLYDFGAQVGDQLQIFSGINNYNYYDYYETYTHVVTRREYLDDGRIKLTSIPFFGDPVPDDINENNYSSVTWIEGVGSEHGIVHNNINNLPGMGTEWLLCAYRDDECRYTTDDPEYAPLGCVYNEGDVINAVESVSISAPSVQKIIKDGQLLILRDGQTYNVMGMEVK